MEELIVALLVIAVLWLMARQSGRSADRRKLQELVELVARLDRRLSRVEQSPPQSVAAPAPAIPAAPPPRPEPVTPPIVHAQPAQPSASFRPGQLTPAEAALLDRNPLKEAAVPDALPLIVSEPAERQAEAAAAPPPRSISLEERLGQNWLNKLGIVTLVIGVALFLGYQMRTLGPMGKSLIGLSLSVALLAGGLLLERRPQYRIFARAGIGGGWALTFFVTFALYHVDAMRVLTSQSVDLVLMMAVAVAMVAHSLHYKSQVVTSLAFLLAFVTVGISEITMFSLVAGALLAAGLVFVAARESWFGLGLAGLVGVYLNHFLWLERVLPNGGEIGHPFPEFFPSAGLLILYWLLFRMFYVYRVPADRTQRIVSTIAAILNSAGLLGLLKYQSAHPEWAFRALLVLGAAELGLAFLARRRNHLAFVVLSSIASVLLLGAIPFRFSGSHWSMLWLLEAEVLFIAGVRMREIVFRRLGMLAGFAALAQILMTGAAPIFDLRQTQADGSAHLPVALALLVAAMLFWFNAEFATRRWDFVIEDEIDRVGLLFTSYLALLAAAIGLWVCFPGAWTIVAWMIAALLLAWSSDRIGSRDLATHCDLLAMAAVARAVGFNLFQMPHGGWLAPRTVSVMLACALLYAAMGRKMRAHAMDLDYVPSAYTWAATGLFATLLWYQLQPISVAVAWGVFGLVLFELGMALRRRYFRHQAYALLAASFVRIFFANLNVAGSGSLITPRMYTVVPLIAAYFWVYERMQAEADRSRFERGAGVAAAWAGTIAAAALVYFEVRAEWIAMAWAVLAMLLIALGWALRRTLFVAQALALLLAGGVRAMMFNMFAPAALGGGFVGSRIFCVGAGCALMLLSLPMAFGVRRQHAAEAETHQGDWRWFLVYRPEQAFFFVPVLLITVLLAMELRAGMITIGWSALGVVVFLFALWVGERSFRLAGLTLLLLGVGKIIFVDIWNATPSDRYITLIVMGAALLLVSFLYSRYRETILKFL